jgi:hypothetical protein
VSQFSRQRGNLDISQTNVPPRSVTGIALPFQYSALIHLLKMPCSQSCCYMEITRCCMTIRKVQHHIRKKIHKIQQSWEESSVLSLLLDNSVGTYCVICVTHAFMRVYNTVAVIVYICAGSGLYCLAF